VQTYHHYIIVINNNTTKRCRIGADAKFNRPMRL